MHVLVGEFDQMVSCPRYPVQTTSKHVSVIDSGVLRYITSARMRQDIGHLEVSFYVSFLYPKVSGICAEIILNQIQIKA